MPLTSPGNDDDTGENHQPTLRKNTAEPVEQTLKQNNLWRCPACGRELDEEENDDGTITLVCPAHQVGWGAGHEDEPYPMGGLVFRPTMGGGVFIAGPCMAVCLDRTSAVNAFFALGETYGLTRIEGVRP